MGLIYSHSTSDGCQINAGMDETALQSNGERDKLLMMITTVTAKMAGFRCQMFSIIDCNFF